MHVAILLMHCVMIGCRWPGMLAQTASLAGATPEQTAALIRQLVQGSASSGIPLLLCSCSSSRSSSSTSSSSCKSLSRMSSMHHH